MALKGVRKGQKGVFGVEKERQKRKRLSAAGLFASTEATGSDLKSEM